MPNCEHCGTQLLRATKGRPQTRFCSRACKDLARTAEKTAGIRAARVGRKCAHCGGLIPESVNLRAKTCSRDCGVAYQNHRKQEGARNAWLASKRPCEHCGGEIPTGRHAGSKFCSPECKRNTHSARWREKSPGYMRQYLYGLTPERYSEMLTEQGNACAICRATEPGGKGTWHVDHDHTTGANRGLLCHGCNLMLGNAKDDPARLRSAAIYLEAHAGRTLGSTLIT